MPIHFVLLSSDLLFWLLILAMGITLYSMRHQETLRRPWQQVVSSPMACITGVIVLLYVGIAFIDSIHFQYNGARVQSVLDWVLYPLGTQDEKTYSIPFSTHLLGQTASQNDMLQYVKPKNVLLTLLVGFLKGILPAVLLIWLCSWGSAYRQKKSLYHAWRSILAGHTIVAARSLIVTTVILFGLFGGLFHLSTAYHILGTGKIGNDIFYESIKSIRAGILIGSLTTLFMLPFALLLGLLAGYMGGWMDEMIQFIYTVLSSIPGVLLISASILALQLFIERHPDLFPSLMAKADARLLALCAVLGLTSWTSLCRLLRAETFKIRELDFVVAAKSLGVKQSTILWKHILPNVFHIILITIVLDFSGLVLAEAVLSYVGVGVDPTMMSWGNMINSARLELSRAPVVWWPLVSAMIFMFILVLSLNLFADKVRDAFDPRMR